MGPGGAPGALPSAEGRGVLDGEGLGPNGRHAVGNVAFRIVRKLEPPEADLDGDPPRTGHGKKRVVGGVLDRPQVLAESLQLGQQPEEDVGIEEQPHTQDSKASRTSASSGPSKSSGTTSRPRSIPNVRARLGTYRHQARRRLSAAGDHDLLTRGDVIEEPGEMGLGLVDSHGLSHELGLVERVDPSLPGQGRFSREWLEVQEIRRTQRYGEPLEAEFALTAEEPAEPHDG